MAEDATQRAYHGRRRGSLPAIKLHASMAPGASQKSPRRQRASTTDNLPDHHGHDVRAKSATSQRQWNGKASSSSSSSSSVRLASAGHAKPSEKAASSEDSPRTSPNPARYRNRAARRHSVDALTSTPTRPETSAELESIRRAWSRLCRISDQKTFDPGDYEKACPHGSSLFKSVLSELKEEEPPADAPWRPLAEAPSDGGGGGGPRRGRRQVRFKSESDSDS